MAIGRKLRQYIVVWVHRQKKGPPRFSGLVGPHHHTPLLLRYSLLITYMLLLLLLSLFHHQAFQKPSSTATTMCCVAFVRFFKNTWKIFQKVFLEGWATSP